MRHTRSDIASFKTVYRDTGRALWDAVLSVKQATVYLVLIPVHLLVWLWLPELSPTEKDARAAHAKAWADADV